MELLVSLLLFLKRLHTIQSIFFFAFFPLLTINVIVIILTSTYKGLKKANSIVTRIFKMLICCDNVV